MKRLITLFAALVAAVALACDAITAKGKQCSRASEPGSRYCWQHGEKKATAKATTTVPKSYQVYEQRKATQGARTFSKSMRQQRFKEQGGVCPHCGKSCAFEEMEGDHIVPYSKGGKTVYSNLQMLCRPCNRSKGNRYSH